MEDEQREGLSTVSSLRSGLKGRLSQLEGGAGREALGGRDRRTEWRGKDDFVRDTTQTFDLPFVNADNLARQLDLEAYKAASAADAIRRELLRQRASFCFETVFSDPVGDKVAFLKELGDAGYQVVLCFIGISAAEISEQRVAIRVSKGGHDVPSQKIAERYTRTLKNLRLAIQVLADVRVFDNDDLARPYRLVARCEAGSVVDLRKPIPSWLQPLLPKA